MDELPLDLVNEIKSALFCTTWNKLIDIYKELHYNLADVCRLNSELMNTFWYNGSMMFDVLFRNLLTNNLCSVILDKHKGNWFPVFVMDDNFHILFVFVPSVYILDSSMFQTSDRLKLLSME